MPITRKILLHELRDLFFFFLASLVQGYLMCTKCRFPDEYFRSVGFTFVIWVVLWKGNDFLSTQLTKRFPWIKYPTQRLIIGIVSTMAYTVGIMIVIMTVFEWAFNFNFGKGYQYTIYGSILVTILISLFLHGRAFFSFWKQATLEKEQYMRESISAKYESLKSQVNPHFLFNSLNALSNLVYEDQAKAVKFIKQLSDVYRYVLETRDREVVSLQEEMKFLESYVFLQKIRFGEKLKFDLQTNGLNTCVAPLAIQMLIENAIKHNIISEEQPLSIRIRHDETYLIVENNLQRKQAIGDTSPGIGLDNIRKRYEMLSETKTFVIEENGKFVVRLPLLKMINR